MAEYIEREALLETLKEFRLNETMSKHLTREDCETARNAIERAQMVIECIPAADVAPVRHGRWQYNTDFYVWCCSECGKNPTKGTGVVTTAEKLPAYCPHCGAKMDGAE